MRVKSILTEAKQIERAVINLPNCDRERKLVGLGLGGLRRFRHYAYCGTERAVEIRGIG